MKGQTLLLAERTAGQSVNGMPLCVESDVCVQSFSKMKRLINLIVFHYNRLSRKASETDWPACPAAFLRNEEGAIPKHSVKHRQK